MYDKTHTVCFIPVLVHAKCVCERQLKSDICAPFIVSLYTKVLPSNFIHAWVYRAVEQCFTHKEQSKISKRGPIAWSFASYSPCCACHVDLFDYNLFVLIKRSVLKMDRLEISHSLPNKKKSVTTTVPLFHNPCIWYSNVIVNSRYCMLLWEDETRRHST